MHRVELPLGNEFGEVGAEEFGDDGHAAHRAGGVTNMSRVRDLVRRKLVSAPAWLPDNLHYEVVMGSQAYGVWDDTSDLDITGWAIPPKDDLFPHLRGEIIGFGTPRERFEQLQRHHITDVSADGAATSYDVTVFSVVKYFHLAMGCNPNILDSLFVPSRWVLHCTRVGQIVRDERRLFLSQLVWPKFKGYAYSQLHKLATKSPTGRRADTVAKHGYDTKYAYHVVRLLGEAEQMLAEGDLELGRNAAMLRDIRAGAWTEGQLRAWASAKELELESKWRASALRAVPDEGAVKALLLRVLEEHYGKLGGEAVAVDAAVAALKAIAAELGRVRHLLG